MIDFTNGNNNRFNPDEYIKTRSGSLLAYIKVIEAAAACIGLVGLIIASFGISTALNNVILQFNKFLSDYLPSSSLRLPGFLSHFPFLIPAFFLVLVILDAFGVFMFRFANRGESLVSLVHRIFWIISIIEIIILVISFFQIQNLTNDSSASLDVIGIFLLPILVVSLGCLLFQCSYHHEICTVLKAVHEEKRSGQVAVVGNNHLMGRSGWLAWGSGILFVYSAVLFIYPLLTNKQIAPEETLKSFPNLAPMVILGINFIFCLLLFLKYLSLRICMRNFLKYHTEKKRKSSALIIIILVIILCIAAYAIGKNNGTRNLLNQKSPESTRIVKTSTPVSDISNTSPTATPNSYRNSLPTPTVTMVPTKVSTKSGGVDPNLKEFLDGYERFMDQYVAFMKKYESNPSDLTLMTQYFTMLSELSEYSEAADRWSEKESEMSAADWAYYTATMLRINNKMLSAY